MTGSPIIALLGPVPAFRSEVNSIPWDPATHSFGTITSDPPNWNYNYGLPSNVLASPLDAFVGNNNIYDGFPQDIQETHQHLNPANFSAQSTVPASTNLIPFQPRFDPSFAAPVPVATIQPGMLFPGNLTLSQPPGALPAAASGPAGPIQPRITCTLGCSISFKRDSDRIRHEHSVHRLNQALGMHLCSVPGCPKGRGVGYTRKDKLTEHMWKKHANLGYAKKVSPVFT